MLQLLALVLRAVAEVLCVLKQLQPGCGILFLLGAVERLPLGRHVGPLPGANTSLGVWHHGQMTTVFAAQT